MSVQAETEFSDELMEKIVAYVEREEGRDAPLSAEDEAMVRKLLETNPAAQALADDLRSTNARLSDLFETSTEVEVPEHLATMIRAHGALRTEREGGRATGKVIPFRAEPEPAKRTRSYAPLAAAASIALVLAGGGLLYQNTVFDQERQQFQAELAGAETTLAERVTELQQLQTEQATQERRLASLADENGELGQQIAAAEAERDQLAGELESAQAAVDSALASADADREALLADVADLNSQLTTKQQQVGDLTAELTSTVDQARATTASLEQLRDDHQALETRVATLGSDNRNLTERLSATEDILAAVEQQNTTLVAAASQAEDAMRVAQAEAETARSQFELEKLALGEALGVSDQELAEADRRTTELATERDALAGQIEQSSERIAALEDDLDGALGELVSSRSTNDQLAAETEQLREQGSWLNQVVGYHRLYAGTPREVEVSAAEQEGQQALTNWFKSMLGRNFSVPDLSAAGLTFVGGRVFAVNGIPTGQIAYHDRQGQLTGFCFKPGSEDQESGPTFRQDDDLNLISWQKNGIDYVLVGWMDPAELGLIGTQLQRNYGEGI